jgi:hypothetical protein
MAKTAAWTSKRAKTPKGGLNAKGRASYNKANPGKPGLKAPAPSPKTEKDAARRKSFCARMSGMKSKLTSSKTAKDPNSRINKSLELGSAEMDMTIWNLALTCLSGVLGWVLKDKSDELGRITILLNRTREEMAKEYVTKTEVHADINRVLDRLERLDEKLDRLMESRNVK